MADEMKKFQDEMKEISDETRVLNNKIVQVAGKGGLLEQLNRKYLVILNKLN